MMDVTTHLGMLRADLFIPQSHSLKDKRMVLKRLKDKVRAQFNVSVGELDGMDKWQRATLGFVMVGADNRYIDKTLQHLLSFIGSYHAVEVLEHAIEFY